MHGTERFQNEEKILNLQLKQMGKGILSDTTPIQYDPSCLDPQLNHYRRQERA